MHPLYIVPYEIFRGSLPYLKNFFIWIWKELVILSAISIFLLSAYAVFLTLKLEKISNAVSAINSAVLFDFSMQGAFISKNDDIRIVMGIGINEVDLPRQAYIYSRNILDDYRPKEKLEEEAAQKIGSIEDYILTVNPLEIIEKGKEKMRSLNNIKNELEYEQNNTLAWLTIINFLIPLLAMLAAIREHLKPKDR